MRAHVTSCHFATFDRPANNAAGTDKNGIEIGVINKMTDNGMLLSLMGTE